MALVDNFMEIFTYTGCLTKSDSLPDIDKVKTDYDLLFKRAQDRAEAEGYSTGEFMQAAFPVCAWVDETLLCSEWQERQSWVRFQLQRKFFSTSNAGQVFFDRLQSLDSNNRQMQEVYFYCLSLGFKGSYFDEQKKIKFLQGKLARDLGYKDKKIPDELFPQAYLGGVGIKKNTSFSRPSFNWLIVILPATCLGLLFYIYNYLLTEFVLQHFDNF